jgi:hypothetical protein
MGEHALAVATYEQVHAGSTVLGHDGDVWGVEAIDHGPPLAVTLVKHGQRVVGYPPPGTPVTVIEPADVGAEAQAWEVLSAAFGPVEILGERYEG